MYLVQGFKSVFNYRESGGEVYRRNELWLEAIPDLEWGSSCSAVCSDVVGKFGEWE